MKFYAGQRLKFKEEWSNFRNYKEGEEVVVVRLDKDGDPEIHGVEGMDYFYSEGLEDLVEEIVE